MHVLSIIIFAAWFLAFLRTIVNLALIPRLRAGGMAPKEPLVSVIIPARDEARIIERTVRAFLAQSYPNLEVIVVNDRSVDGTGEILRTIGDERLRVIDGEEPPAGWLGKPWALHQGSRLARGELLLFVDADVVYSSAALRAAVAHWQLRRPVLLSFVPYFEMRGLGENAAMPMLAMFCFTFMPAWLSNRSRIAALAIGGGPATSSSASGTRPSAAMRR